MRLFDVATVARILHNCLEEAVMAKVVTVLVELGRVQRERGAMLKSGHVESVLL